MNQNAISPKTLNMKLIRESLLKAAPKADLLVETFFEVFQSQHPNINMTKEKANSLLASVAYIVDNLEDPPKLGAYLRSTLRRNKTDTISTETVAFAHSALIRSLALNLSELWTDELEAQWTFACNLVLNFLSEPEANASNRKIA